MPAEPKQVFALAAVGQKQQGCCGVQLSCRFMAALRPVWDSSPAQLQFSVHTQWKTKLSPISHFISTAPLVQVVDLNRKVENYFPPFHLHCSSLQGKFSPARDNPALKSPCCQGIWECQGPLLPCPGHCSSWAENSAPNVPPGSSSTSPCQPS